MRWTAKKIRKIGKLMGEGKTRSQILCQMSDVSAQGLKYAMAIIKEYGTDKAAEILLYKVNDVDRGLIPPKEKEKRKKPKKNNLTKVAVRATELGTSYGLYVASEQYRIDVCEGLYS